MVNNWLKNIHQFFYPPWCLLCADPGWKTFDLCQTCFESLPWLNGGCQQCGLPLSGSHLQLCGRCLSRRPWYDQTKALWHYHAPVCNLLAALKFKGHVSIARTMGEIMADRIDSGTDRPDCLLPVPLHTQRYRQRGFNQALEIGRPLSSRTRIPLRPELCRRIQPTKPQTQLNAKARRRNLKNAFRIEGKVENLYIAVIDDVMTTGTTANELAKTLKKAGASRVDVWIASRA